MMHILRPPSESAFPVADALSNVPRCLEALESAVADLVSHFWDESFRKRAYDLAQAMSDGCKVCGFKESSRLLRSMESLLALSTKDTAGIQTTLAERLGDLVALLREQVRKSRGE